MANIRWEHCRVCGGELEFLFSLGDQYINHFPEDKPERETCPINMTQCVVCKLVQLEHTAPQELLYSGHYWYKSKLNKIIREDLQKTAEEVNKLLLPGDSIIDVGANDGTFLSYVSDDFNRIGVEPAENLYEELKTNCDRAYANFWEDYVGPQARVITAFGMMYDTDDPVAFLEKVEQKLAPGGVFIAQLMTSKQMVDMNDIGNMCHEHILYFTYNTLKQLYLRAGLEIYRIQTTPINGGSYKIYAKHYNNGSVPYPEEEIDWDLFAEKIEDNKQKTVDMIRGLENVYVYGASTKGNTILQYYGLTGDDIKGAADIDETKWGKKMITGIPIVSEEEARKNAKYFLMIPYGFKDFFIEREKEWLDKGGKFIVPFPEPYICE